MAKNKALGMKVAIEAGHDPAYGRMLDGLKHHSAARLKAAKKKRKK